MVYRVGCSGLGLLLLLSAGCGDSGGDSDASATGLSATDSGTATDESGDSTTSASGTAEGSGSTDAGDGDADSGDGDGDSADAETGDGDAGDGDGDSTSGDGDGDGDSTSGDGDGDGDSTSGDGDTTGDGDGDTGSTGGDSTTGGDCLECSISLATTASSIIELTGPNNNLGLINLEAENQMNMLIDAPVYGLFEWGAGRVITTADTNILYGETTDCPLWEWLGDTPTLPTVGAFGKRVCGGLGNNLGNYPDHTFWGNSMPAQYVNDPAALKADFDVVIFCTLGPISNDVTQTLADYAYTHGGGLLLASEYYPWADDDDVAAINSVANQFNVNFVPEHLDWGAAVGTAEFSCFPIPE